ncbi:hypothetical protein Dimus_008382 [Dionaea muscipula]
MEWAALGDGEMGRRGWWWLMEARMGDGGVVGADGGVVLGDDQRMGNIVLILPQWQLLCSLSVGGVEQQ